MTESEARDFLKQAFIAFPGVSQWVQEHSPDPKSTIGIWSSCLEQVSAPEAISVLSRWVKNELPPPSGYQRELFVNHVVAVVQQDRTKAFAARHREKVLGKLQMHEKNRKYTSVCGPFIKQVMAAKDKYDSGQIDFAELKRQVEEMELKALQRVV